MKASTFITVVIGILALACSTGATAPAEPIPNMDAPMEGEPSQLVGTQITPTQTATIEPIPTSPVIQPPTYRSQLMPTNTMVPTKVRINSPTQTPMTRPTRSRTSTKGAIPVEIIVPKLEFTQSTKGKSFSNGLESAFKAAVDEEFSAAPEKAGISVAVYADGALWTYATGEAEEAVEMTTLTPLMVSSTSKTFLSALILKQIEDGLYALTDSLENLLSNHPEFQSFASDKINPEVTVQDLLTMSSGLPNFMDNVKGKIESLKRPVWTPFDTVNLVQSQFSEPGTFDYNDTNVVLLGLIAESHSGKRLSDLYRQTFFEPLGLTALTLPEEGISWHPGIFTDPGNQLTIPDVARPYGDTSAWAPGFGSIIKAAPFDFGYFIGAVGRTRYACCGIVSNPANIARWAYELYSPNGSAVSESVRDRLLNSFSADRVPVWSSVNSQDQYGYLVTKGRFRLPDGTVVTAYGHPGGGGGYSSFMRYIPELDLSISILANSELKFRAESCQDKFHTCLASTIFDEYSKVHP